MTRPQSRFIRCPKCFQSSKSTFNANSEPQCISCGTIYSTRRLTQEESNTEPHIAKAVFPIRRFEGWLASDGKSSAHTVSIASELKYKKKGVMQRNTSQLTNAPRRLLQTEYVEDFSRIHIIEVPLKRISHLTSEWIDNLSNLYFDPSLPGDEGDDSVMKRLRSYDTSEYINTRRLLEDVLALDPDHDLIHAKREFSRSFVITNLKRLWVNYDNRAYSYRAVPSGLIYDFHPAGRFSRQLDNMGLGKFEDFMTLIHDLSGRLVDFADNEHFEQRMDDLEDYLRNGTQILFDIFNFSFPLPKKRTKDFLIPTIVRNLYPIPLLPYPTEEEDTPSEG